MRNCNYARMGFASLNVITVSNEAEEIKRSLNLKIIKKINQKIDESSNP